MPQNGDLGIRFSVERAYCINSINSDQLSCLGDGGFDDILYAVPITEDKFAAADQLNRRLESFQVMADHPVTVEKLTARTVAKPLSVVVMVDCGYHRDGVDPQDERSVALVQACAPAVGPCGKG